MTKAIIQQYKCFCSYTADSAALGSLTGILCSLVYVDQTDCCLLHCSALSISKANTGNQTQCLWNAGNVFLWAAREMASWTFTPPPPESRLECFTEWWRARMGAVRTWREARQEFSLNKTMCGSWADSPKHSWRRPKTTMAHISSIGHRLCPTSLKHCCSLFASAMSFSQVLGFPLCICIYLYVCTRGFKTF